MWFGLGVANQQKKPHTQAHTHAHTNTQTRTHTHTNTHTHGTAQHQQHARPNTIRSTAIRCTLLCPSTVLFSLFLGTQLLMTVI